MLLHRQRKAAPEPFRKAVAPYRDRLVVAVACLFPWYGLADLCAAEGIAFVLGHALSMKAIHGGKAKHDKIDSQKIAALLRGGLLPQAYVYPAAMRATRDLLRRRTHLRRQRAELLAHVQNTNSQYNLPEMGKKIAYQANREGVAERFADAAVQKTIEVDLTLLTYYDELLRALALSILTTAKQHDANTLYLLQTVPGIGKILSLVLLYQSMTLTASHGCRTSPRIVAWSSVRKNLLANAWVPLARKSATPISSGPFPKLPFCSCGTIPKAKSTWPAWRKSMIKAKPSPSWLINWRGPSIIGSSAKQPLIWTCSCVPKGAERVNLRSNWTPMGSA